MHNTPQRDTMIGQHMRVILQVLSQLRECGIFQPVPELAQHMLARQLLRRAGITVLHRHIGSDAGLDAERQSDDLGAHRIQRRRFGIKGC